MEPLTLQSNLTSLMQSTFSCIQMCFGVLKSEKMFKARTYKNWTNCWLVNSLINIIQKIRQPVVHQNDIEACHDNVPSHAGETSIDTDITEKDDVILNYPFKIQQCVDDFCEYDYSSDFDENWSSGEILPITNDCVLEIIDARETLKELDFEEGSIALDDYGDDADFSENTDTKFPDDLSVNHESNSSSLNITMECDDFSEDKIMLIFENSLIGNEKDTCSKQAHLPTIEDSHPEQCDNHHVKKRAVYYRIDCSNTIENDKSGQEPEEEQLEHVESLNRFLPTETTNVRTFLPRKVLCSTERDDILRLLMRSEVNHTLTSNDTNSLQPVFGERKSSENSVLTKHVDEEACPLKETLRNCLTAPHQPHRNESLNVYLCQGPIGVLEEMHINVKTNADAQKLHCDFKYEWIRYMSFQGYPKTSNMYPSSLAGAGWFYSGMEGTDWVTCFDCGKSYANWNKGEDSRQHHASSCRVLRGTSSNVPIHERNLSTLQDACQQESTPALTDMNRSVVAQTSSAGLNDLCPSQECSTIPASRDTTGTCHQTEDNSNQDSERRSNETISNQNSYVNFQHQNEGNNAGTNDLESLSQKNNDTTTTSKIGVSASRTSSRDNTSEDLASGQNISNKLKHPAYESMDTRTKSFQGWPAGKTQTPKDMALAGMFYAGYEDYVRCHCCGVGLRNWDNGDDPWVEHARWSPTCDYVIRTRGKKFVDLIQRKAKEKEAERSASATNRDKSAHSSKESEMQSLAIKYIKDMGYSEDRITIALTEMKKRLGPGRHKVTAHDLLEIILQQSQEAAAGGNEATLDNTATTKNLSSTENKPTSTDRRSSDDRSKENTSKHEGDQRNILQDHKELTEQLTCKICMERSVAITFIPCGHLACCEQCSRKVMRCPICRARIKEKHKTYLT